MDDEGIEEPVSPRSVDEAPGAAPSAATGDDASRRPSFVAWAVLGILVIGAIGFALIRDDVLIEDDFSTPEALRAWPDDDGAYVYADGEYRLMTTPRGVTYAYRELPREVGGLAISIDVHADPRAVGLIDCVSEATVDGDSQEVFVDESYSVIVDGTSGGYAFVSGSSILQEGSMSKDVGTVSFTCISDGTEVTLLLEVPGDGPFEATDDRSDVAFTGIGLGAISESPGDVVAFDDLRVTGADGKDS